VTAGEAAASEAAGRLPRASRRIVDVDSSPIPAGTKFVDNRADARRSRSRLRRRAAAPAARSGLVNVPTHRRLTGEDADALAEALWSPHRPPLP
jgi:hypothetical protein